MSGQAARRRRREREERETQVVRSFRSLVDAHAYDDPELLERETISADDIFDLLRDDALAQVYDHFNKLRATGADVLARTVIVVGYNSVYPGMIMVQSQCDAQRVGFELNDELEPLGVGEAIEPTDDEMAEQLAKGNA